MATKSVVQEIIDLNKKKIDLVEQLIKANPLVGSQLKPLVEAVKQENDVLVMLEPVLSKLSTL